MNKRFQSISVKELRENFPKVRRGLARGIHYTVIHRSKPIGEFSPLQESHPRESEAFRFFANPPKKLMFRSKLSAVELIRREREE